MSNRFDKFLDGIVGAVVETGLSSLVVDLADYAESHPMIELHSVALDMDSLTTLHHQLEELHLAPFVSLHLQEPGKFLMSKSWIDAAFLFSYAGLQGQLDHTRLAMSAGAKRIVLRNYSSQAAWAVQFAKQQKWKVEHTDDGYSVLTRV